jgi:glutathione S-transferase
MAVNPKSKVPALGLDDGAVLTELPAIAFYLARSNPSCGLLPADALGEARVLEAMDYICATLHMQGFARLFRTVNFSPDEATHPAVRARGHEIIAKGLGLLDAQLAGRDWLVGTYSVADAALFFIEMWGKRGEITLPANVAAHFLRMQARPAVQRALAREGLTP